LPGKGSPKRDKGKVCPFGRKVIESKLKYGFGCPKSASRKECEDILCNTRLKPLIIQRFPNGPVFLIHIQPFRPFYHCDEENTSADSILGIEIRTANASWLPVCFFMPFLRLLHCRSKERLFCFLQEML
jgi:hypothetical protein